MLIKQTKEMTERERIAVQNSNNQFLQALSYVAVGTIFSYAGKTAPKTFMFCDGRALDITEYAELFEVIGYTFGGSGDIFNLPNLCGKTLVGLDDSNTKFDSVGKTGGKEEVTLTSSEMPEHAHKTYALNPNTNGVKIYANYFDASYAIDYVKSAINASTVGWSNEIAVGGAGGGLAHENMPPYVVCNYIIKVANGISKEDFRLPIDQVYNLESENAQSGKAVAEALSLTTNAILLTAKGKQISLSDVSPIEHKIKCSITSDTYLETVDGSKNLLDISDWDLRDKEFGDGATLTCERNKDGTFTLNGHTGGKGGIGYLSCNTNMTLKAEQTYTLSFITGDTSQLNDVYFYLDANVVYYDEDIDDYISKSLRNFKIDNSFSNDCCITFELPKEITDNMEGIFISYDIEIRDSSSAENLIIYPQLELGSEVTEWVEYEEGGSYVEKPYIEDLSLISVEVQSSGGTETYRANADGIVTGIISRSPNMIITADSQYININCQYNVDTKKYIDNNSYNKSEIDNLVGDIETVLDNIIEIQNSLIGGNE